MTYAIDTDGTREVGSTLLTTSTALRDCGTAAAYAAGLASRGVADDQPSLSAALRDFTDTHLRALELFTAAYAALAGDLTWAAWSAHQVELAVASEFGAGTRGGAGSGTRATSPSGGSS